MTFARGVTLTTATTFGHADTSDLGPTAGNGFYKHWPDDLALLQQIGITDIRLTLDWARLQPRPGTFDTDWAERFDNILATADAIDLRVWATLHDGAVPRWLDNEGGLDDDAAAARWWPRWVERTAERYGDRVHGWVPFARIPTGISPQPWRDTWGILSNGGRCPVVASVGRTADVGQYLGRCDLVGVDVTTGFDPDARPHDGELHEMGEHMTGLLHDIADAASGTAVIVSQFSPANDDPDVDERLVEHFVAAVDAAIDDGIQVTTAFLDPGIAAPDTVAGLLDADRAPRPAAAAYLPN